MSRKILVVTDLHSGSKFSVMPNEVWVDSANGNEHQNCVLANGLQTRLYHLWQGMVDECGTVDAVINLGDSVDGPNRKSNGFELWTSSLYQQCNTAADLLSEIRVRKRRHYGVQGSTYHVNENTSCDLAVTKALGGEFGTDLALDLWGVRVHCSHVMAPSGSPVSKATAAQSELMWSEINAEYFGEFDLILRGHRHEYLDLQNAHGRIISCPAWKGRDAYISKMGLKAAGAEVGYILLTLDNGEINVEPHIYLLKRDQIIKEVTIRD